MELDDQLAALAAGELDDDTARALRARAAADPAVARRLARHERLDALLSRWDTPALSAEAVARLDDVVDEALDALGDEPLSSRAAPTGPLAATTTSERDDATPQPAEGVVDLAAARQRREERRGLPAWLPAATVAAALVVVVGTGVIGGGLFGGADDATEDSIAADVAEESDEEMAEEDSATAAVPESSDEAMDGAMDGEMADESAALAPAARSGVEITEGELLALLDSTFSATTDSQGGDGAAGDDEASDDSDEAAGDPVESCVVEALERDTAEADGREVWQLASGDYADRDAVFVVIRTPSDQPGDRYEVLAYDPSDCSLLARDETIR